MPRRHHDDQNYRYGYQGSEKDDEISGVGNSYTTHFRQLDVSLARWWDVDPKANLSQSPYLSMGGSPVMYNDPFGDIFRIGRGDKQAKADVTSIVGSKRKREYHNFAEDGTVSLNLSGLKQKKKMIEY
jgi:RHS repeat-associated protein